MIKFIKKILGMDQGHEWLRKDGVDEIRPQPDPYAAMYMPSVMSGGTMPIPGNPTVRPGQLIQHKHPTHVVTSGNITTVPQHRDEDSGPDLLTGLVIGAAVESLFDSSPSSSMDFGNSSSDSSSFSGFDGGSSGGGGADGSF